jgi:hypothetical protein
VLLCFVCLIGVQERVPSGGKEGKMMTGAIKIFLLA